MPFEPVLQGSKETRITFSTLSQMIFLSQHLCKSAGIRFIQRMQLRMLLLSYLSVE